MVAESRHVRLTPYDPKRP